MRTLDKKGSRDKKEGLQRQERQERTENTEKSQEEGGAEFKDM